MQTTNQRVLELLKKAKKLISNSRNWTQGRYARTYTKMDVTFDSPEAECFCSVGAIKRIVLKLPEYRFAEASAYDALDRAAGRSGLNIVRYNDTHTHEEVMKVWDSAINQAMQESRDDS